MSNTLGIFERISAATSSTTSSADLPPPEDYKDLKAFFKHHSVTKVISTIIILGLHIILLLWRILNILY